jgi:SAM-dependent methyltransferase
MGSAPLNGKGRAGATAPHGDGGRVRREIAHGRFLCDRGPESVWNWGTPAGRLRWRRREALLTTGVGPGTAVLEIGCGTGSLAAALAGLGASVTAMDVSEPLLSEARKKVGEGKALFLRGDAHGLPFRTGSFHRVLGSSILHHLNLERALPEILRVLKPGGRIAFAEPNLVNPQVLAMKKLSFFGRWMGESPDETAFIRWKLGRVLRSRGFSRVRIVPFDFLHPLLPAAALDFSAAFCFMLEKIPLLREAAGSLFISAEKEGAGPGAEGGTRAPGGPAGGGIGISKGGEDDR